MTTTTAKAHTETEHLKKKAIESAQEGVEKANGLVEEAASKTPSLLFAGAALASIAVSLYLQLRGKRHWGLFVGHWAPTFLLFGLYNKFSKTVGPA